VDVSSRGAPKPDDPGDRLAYNNMRIAACFELLSATISHRAHCAVKNFWAPDLALERVNGARNPGAIDEFPC